MRLDLTRGIFEWPGVAGARIRPGFSPHNASAPLGDSALLNFESGFFAVSDSSDRDPRVSARFLSKFDRMLTDTCDLGSDRRIAAGEIGRLIDHISCESEKILEDMLGVGTCTFTGLLFLQTDDGLMSLIFHTGDGDMYEYDVKSSQLTELTVKNFWLVGKTEKLFQITLHKISTPGLFVMGTDGVGLSGGRAQPAIKDNLMTIMRGCAVERIPEEILNAASSGNGFQDDMTALAISTSGLRCENLRILMGSGER